MDVFTRIRSPVQSAHHFVPHALILHYHSLHAYHKHNIRNEIFVGDCASQVPRLKDAEWRVGVGFGMALAVLPGEL